MRVYAFFALLGKATASVVIANSSVTSQVRVAFHGDDGMVVSWNTFKQLTNPTVLYGLTADSMTESASSDVSVTYPTSLTYNNHVWIDGLLPDTTYYYQPQDLLANETVYGPYTFKTARPAGDHTPYSIAFVCDLGTMGSGTLGLTDIPNKKTDANEILTPGEQTTIDSLVASLDTYDFLVHPGDLAYSDYWLKEELAGYINATIEEGPALYETILNEFYDEMEAISAFRPYMIGVGNHEADCDNGGSGSYTGSICVEGQTNFTGVRNHFRMPSDISGGVGNFWYSFDYGMVHYVYFNTETDLGNGLLNDEQAPLLAGPFGSYPNEQVDWLEADLAAVDRCATPWVVALGHRPWFTSGDNCANCSVAFSEMFENHGVDMVLQGHFHVYERNVPVFTNGTIDPNGYNNPSTPWYLINGLAGHWGGMDDFTEPVEDFHVFGLSDADATYGWSRLHFFNSTHLQHEFVASNNNSVLDTTILYKEHVCLSQSSSSSSSAVASSTSASASASGIASASASSVSGSASASASGSASGVVSGTATASPSSIADCETTSVSGSASGSATGSTSGSATGSAWASGSAVVSGSTTATASSSYTTSTILSTTTYTIVSCAPTVTNCPVGHVTTDVVTLLTTWCPEATETGSGNGSGSGSGSGNGNGSSAQSTAKVGTTSVAKATQPGGLPSSVPTGGYTNSTGSGSGSGSGSGTSSGSGSGSSSGNESGSGSGNGSTSGNSTTGAGSIVVTAGSSNIVASAASVLLAVMVGAIALL